MVSRGAKKRDDARAAPGRRADRGGDGREKEMEEEKESRIERGSESGKKKERKNEIESERRKRGRVQRS